MARRMTEKNRFTLWEYPQLVEHLEYMAQNGWMLEDFNEAELCYEECQPRKVHFAVTFFPEYDFLDPCVPENLQRLWDFCRESGWQHITDSSSMQIFYNERENPLPIHTDAVVQLENFHSMINVLKLKNWRQDAVINGAFTVFLAIVAGMFIRDTSFAYMVERVSALSLLIAAYYIYRCISALCSLAGYYSWYVKARRAAAEKDIFTTFCPNRIWADADGAISSFFLCGMAVLLAKNGEIVSTLLFAVPFAILFLIVVASAKYMKKNGVSAKDNRRIIWVIAAVFVLLFVIALPYIIMTIADMGLGGDMITHTIVYP